MMSAVVFALVMTSAPAPNLGLAIAGRPHCYAVGDRYSACVKFDASGALRRINIEPRAWLTAEPFDRRRALSEGEYLDVITKLGGAVDIGEYLPDHAPQANAVTNGLYASIEEWSNATVRKWIVAGEGTVLSIDVMFYRRVSGRVRVTTCMQVIDDRNEVGCKEAALGPKYVTIDNEDYVVAPRDRRKFTPGEAVDIHVADLRN